MDFSDWNSVDSYYDPYDQENDDLFYLEEAEMLRSYNAEAEWIFNLKSMFFYCMAPSVIQAIIKFSPLFISTLLSQIVAFKTNLSVKTLTHLNLGISLAVLVHFFTVEITSYLVALGVICYVIQNSNLSKYLVVASCFLHLITGQLYLERENWMSFRGAEMILIMKLISIVSDEQVVTDFPTYLNYLLSVQTSVIGPWISFNQYKIQIESKSKLSKENFKDMFKYFLYTFLTLTCSNCLLNLFEGYLEGVPFLEMYFQAFSFRQSNYFICYLTQFFISLNQFQSFDKKSNEFKIIEQNKIEFPRSMLDVVTNWNLPMHFWLKRYVFDKMKPNYGIFVSICATYFVSSAIHGFDPNIILVLFSIGWFAYVEFEFRSKLSRKLNSCLGSRVCNDKCTHRNKHNFIPVKTMNSYFYLLNIYHLAYLGQLFYFDYENIQETLKFSHGLAKWSQTYFSSHIISICMFLMSKFM